MGPASGTEGFVQEPSADDLDAYITAHLDEPHVGVRLVVVVSLLESDLWLPDASPADRVAQAFAIAGRGQDWPAQAVQPIFQRFADRNDLDFSALICRTVFAQGPAATSCDLARSALTDQRVAHRLSEPMAALLSLEAFLAPGWYRFNRQGEAARLTGTAARILLAAGTCLPGLTQTPYADRVAPHVLLAALILEENGGQDLAPNVQMRLRSLPDDLIQAVVGPAVDDPAFFREPLAARRWRLAEFLLLRAVAYEVQASDGGTSSTLIDLSALFRPATPGVSAAGSGGTGDGNRRSAGAMTLAKTVAATPVGSLLADYLAEHDDDDLETVIRTRTSFTSSKLDMAMQWVRTQRRNHEERVQRELLARTETSQWR
jgi:hypothetical protein